MIYAVVGIRVAAVEVDAVVEATNVVDALIGADEHLLLGMTEGGLGVLLGAAVGGALLMDDDDDDTVETVALNDDCFERDEEDEVAIVEVDVEAEAKALCLDELH